LQAVKPKNALVGLLRFKPLTVNPTINLGRELEGLNSRKAGEREEVEGKGRTSSA
jgi:hypothetical protein